MAAHGHPTPIEQRIIDHYLEHEVLDKKKWSEIQDFARGFDISDKVPAPDIQAKRFFVQCDPIRNTSCDTDPSWLRFFTEEKTELSETSEKFLAVNQDHRATRRVRASAAIQPGTGLTADIEASHAHQTENPTLKCEFSFTQFNQRVSISLSGEIKSAWTDLGSRTPQSKLLQCTHFVDSIVYGCQVKLIIHLNARSQRTTNRLRTQLQVSPMLRSALDIISRSARAISSTNYEFIVSGTSVNFDFSPGGGSNVILENIKKQIATLTGKYSNIMSIHVQPLSKSSTGALRTEDEIKAQYYASLTADFREKINRELSLPTSQALLTRIDKVRLETTLTEGGLRILDLVDERCNLVESDHPKGTLQLIPRNENTLLIKPDTEFEIYWKSDDGPKQCMVADARGLKSNKIRLRPQVGHAKKNSFFRLESILGKDSLYVLSIKLVISTFERYRRKLPATRYFLTRGDEKGCYFASDKKQALQFSISVQNTAILDVFRSQLPPPKKGNTFLEVHHAEVERRLKAQNGMIKNAEEAEQLQLIFQDFTYDASLRPQLLCHKEGKELCVNHLTYTTNLITTKALFLEALIMDLALVNIEFYLSHNTPYTIGFAIRDQSNPEGHLEITENGAKKLKIVLKSYYDLKILSRESLVKIKFKAMGEATTDPALKNILEQLQDLYGRIIINLGYDILEGLEDLGSNPGYGFERLSLKELLDRRTAINRLLQTHERDVKANWLKEDSICAERDAPGSILVAKESKPALPPHAVPLTTVPPGDSASRAFDTQTAFYKNVPPLPDDFAQSPNEWHDCLHVDPLEAWTSKAKDR